MRSKIPLQTCQSSQIANYGYDAASQTLALQFRNKNGLSDVYHYPNFTPEKFQQFEAAESKGRFFGQNIKGNPDHPHTRMVPDPESSEEKATDPA